MGSRFALTHWQANLESQSLVRCDEAFLVQEINAIVGGVRPVGELCQPLPLVLLRRRLHQAPLDAPNPFAVSAELPNLADATLLGDVQGSTTPASPPGKFPPFSVHPPTTNRLTHPSFPAESILPQPKPSALATSRRVTSKLPVLRLYRKPSTKTSSTTQHGTNPT